MDRRDMLSDPFGSRPTSEIGQSDYMDGRSSVVFGTSLHRTEMVRMPSRRLELSRRVTCRSIKLLSQLHEEAPALGDAQDPGAITPEETLGNLGMMGLGLPGFTKTVSTPGPFPPKPGHVPHHLPALSIVKRPSFLDAALLETFGPDLNATKRKSVFDTRPMRSAEKEQPAGEAPLDTTYRTPCFVHHNSFLFGGPNSVVDQQIEDGPMPTGALSGFERVINFLTKFYKCESMLGPDYEGFSGDDLAILKAFVFRKYKRRLQVE